MKNYFWAIFFLFFNILVGKLFAQEMYVKTNNTKLYSSAAPNSKIVDNLKKNDKVFILKKQNKFYNVKTQNNITGWIYEHSVTAQSPTTKKQDNKLLDSLSSDNYASRDSATSANIRGLSENSKQYAKKRSINPKVLKEIEQLETLNISDAEIEAFLQAGELGEFAKSTAAEINNNITE